MMNAEILNKREWFTSEQLREELHYNPVTGEFNWAKRSRGRKMGKPVGCSMKNKYRIIGIFKGYYLAHRLAWLYVHGKWPKDQIDHKDHNPANNRIANLRQVTHAGNSHNMVMPKRNTSGCVGVCLDKRWNRWVARITVNKKSISLGNHKHKASAIAARKAAEKKYGFHPNHGMKLENING